LRSCPAEAFPHCHVRLVSQTSVAHARKSEADQEKARERRRKRRRRGEEEEGCCIAATIGSTKAEVPTPGMPCRREVTCPLNDFIKVQHVSVRKDEVDAAL
jgi:hypothetical protein